MHYGAIKYCDIANGEGIRTSLFVSGCRNRCKNCFQPETWAFDYDIKSSFVEREHTNNDTVGANTQPENLEKGEYICG